MGVARLLLTSFRFNLNLLLIAPILTTILSVYLSYYYYSSGGLNGNTSLYLFPPSMTSEILLFPLVFATTPAVTLMGKAMKLAVLGPDRRITVYLTNILTTVSLTAIAVYLTALATAAINYYILSYGLTQPPGAGPDLWTAISFQLTFHLTYLEAFVFLSILSNFLLVWSSSSFGGIHSMLIAVMITFFVGFLGQTGIMTIDPRPYYLPLYYMLAFGLAVTGENPKYVPSTPTYDLPGFLPLTIGGAILILFPVLIVGTYLFGRLNLGGD